VYLLECKRLFFFISSLLSRIRNSYFPAEYQLDESEYVENYFQTHLAPLLQEESTEDIPDVKEEILVDWIPVIYIINYLIVCFSSPTSYYYYFVTIY
jgi:hypothetical protein